MKVSYFELDLLENQHAMQSRLLTDYKKMEVLAVLYVESTREIAISLWVFTP